MSGIKMRLASLNSHMDLTSWALCAHEPEEEIHSGCTTQESLTCDYDESLLRVGMRYKDDYGLFGASKPFESDFGRFTDMTEALLHDVEGYLVQENVIHAMRPGAMRVVNKLGGF